VLHELQIPLWLSVLIKLHIEKERRRIDICPSCQVLETKVTRLGEESVPYPSGGE
jgi:hypothetical protein